MVQKSFFLRSTPASLWMDMECAIECKRRNSPWGTEKQYGFKDGTALQTTRHEGSVRPQGQNSELGHQSGIFSVKRSFSEFLD